MPSGKLWQARNAVAKRQRLWRSHGSCCQVTETVAKPQELSCPVLVPEISNWAQFEGILSLPVATAFSMPLEASTPQTQAKQNQKTHKQTILSRTLCSEAMTFLPPSACDEITCFSEWFFAYQQAVPHGRRYRTGHEDGLPPTPILFKGAPILYSEPCHTDLVQRRMPNHPQRSCSPTCYRSRSLSRVPLQQIFA